MSTPVMTQGAPPVQTRPEVTAGKLSKKYMAMHKGLLVLDQDTFIKWSKRNHTTPEIIWAGLAVTALFSVAFFADSFWSIDSAYSQLHTVCVDAAPSVELAQKVRADISDLNARELSFCLVRNGNYDANTLKEADFDRERIADQIVNAAKNITYGQEEQVPLTQILRIYTHYESLITASRSMFEEKNIAQGLSLEREASQLLHQKLFPFVDQLDEANSSQLDKAYSDSVDESARYIAANLFFAVILLFILIALQIWLADRTNRFFNPGLVLATLSAFGFTVYTTGALISSSHYMHSAARDCFQSIHVLLQAKANANDANAHQIGWLLDPGARWESLEEFKTNSLAIFSPGNQSFQEAVNIYNKGSKPGGASGNLAVELDNITFEGEQETAMASLTSWGDYLEACEKVRAQATQAPATSLDLAPSAAAEDHGAPFQTFSANLDQTYQINEKWFLIARDNGFHTLNYCEPLCFITLAAVLGFSFIGVWPRLREYRY